MNDEQTKAVGRRALAAGFEWKPRCLDGHWDRQVVRSRDDESGDPVLALEWCDDNPRLACLSDRAWPDFRDAATLGVLLAQVRDALGEPLAHAGVREVGGLHVERQVRWRVYIPWRDSGTGRIAGSIGVDCDYARTEAEALVAALEWAKGRAS